MKSFKMAIKAAVAAIIFAVIALRVDLSAALQIIAGANFWILAAAVAVSLLIIVADALFWTLSMRPVGLKMELPTALRFGLVGWFFSNIAPSNVGADLFRAAQMRYAGATTERAIRLVAAARLMSLAALIGVIAAGLPYAFSAFDDPADRWSLALIFGLAVGAFAGLLLFGPSLSRIDALKRFKAVDMAAGLSADLRTLFAKTDAFGWLLLAVQHLFRVAGVALVAAALDVDVNLLALLALVPAALLVAMVPLSFGGWGVREASFVYFLGFAGVAAPAALAISIVFGLTRILIGAAGGAVWMSASASDYRFAVDQPHPKG
ncbi:MAG: lysylphosphatidylglycerol synthase transmembrane domain-containing protein [Parvularculaceae bacterium]|nr:lysylphosphatidylglycerol synthase transmembrane domain-containing protein [Parvularculaceae bacterium]